MRLRPASILVATLLFPLGPGIAGAATSECHLPQEERSTAEPVELCGTTTISGTEAGVVVVTLRRPVKLDPRIEEGGGIQIDGTGPFAGVALIQDPPSPSSLGFVAARTPAEWNGVTFTPFGEDLVDCGLCGLPAGRYRLYLLATGAPVTATLHLKGASGSTTLAPEHSTSFDARQLTRRTPVPQDLVGATAGDTIQMGATGFLYVGIRLVGVEVSGAGVLQCPEGDDPPGWLPVCWNDEYFPNNGEPIGQTGDGWIGHGGSQAVSSVEIVGPGRYTQSVWFVSPVPPTRVEMIGVWLTFG